MRDARGTDLPFHLAGESRRIAVRCAGRTREASLNGGTGISGSGVFRSADRGRTWSDVSQVSGPVNFGFPIAIDELDADTVWVVPGISDDQRMAVDGAMCVGRTEDGGQTWTELRNGLPQQHCYDIVFRHALDIRGETLVFGTTTGNLFLSENRGDTWRSLGNYFPPIYSVRFA